MKYLLLLIISLALLQNSSLKNIKFVYQTIRHGSREPFLYNKASDLFGYNWSSSQNLITSGQRESFLVGMKTRDIFKDYLQTSYVRNEIYALSTNYNRTIESGQSYLDGLFYSTKDNKVSEPTIHESLLVNGDDYDLNFPSIDVSNLSNVMIEKIKSIGNSSLDKKKTIVPINLLSNKQTFFPFVGSCPWFEYPGDYNFEVLNNIQKEYYNKHPKFFNNLSIKLEENYKSVKNIWTVSDQIVANYKNGNNIDKFKTEDMKEMTIQDIYLEAEYYNKEFLKNGFFGKYKNNIMTRAGITGFISDFINISERRIAKDKESESFTFSSEIPKMKILFSHDALIIPLLNILIEEYKLDLNTINFDISPGSNIYFQLYTENDSNTEYFVDVYLNFEVIKSLERLSFKDFKLRAQKHFASTQEINDLCNYNTKDENNKTNKKDSKLLTISVVLGVLVCISLIVAVYMKYISSKSRDNIE